MGQIHQFVPQYKITTFSGDTHPLICLYCRFPSLDVEKNKQCHCSQWMLCIAPGSVRIVSGFGNRFRLCHHHLKMLQKRRLC